DSLCGNIANCKRSLKSAKVCVYSLEIVRAKSTFPESDINSICFFLRVHYFAILVFSSLDNVYYR
ncbi:MAG: hypothetical protein ACYSWS_02990, partial [Planctomycetota bacterium]